MCNLNEISIQLKAFQLFFEMKITIVNTFILVFFGIGCFAQIDLSDTTAIVIAHWKMDEVQGYKVNNSSNAKEEDKILSSKETNYEVEIKIIDSTQVGYILEWTRNNFSSSGFDELEESLQKISEDIPIWILTDEFGSSIQALNWEDAGKELRKRAEALKIEYKNKQESLKKINRFIRKTTSKELFESNLIQDIQQLFTYHGAKYKFDERIDFKEKVPNNFGGDPLDANSTLIMDQVNLTQGTFIIRSAQRINPDQLTAVTYDYLASLNMVGAELPPFEEFYKVTKLIWGGAEIHGNSGWVIFSEETKQTQHDKVVTTEERTIELVRERN